MRLNPKQCDFTRLAAELIFYMISKGYHPRVAYAFRSKEEAKRLGFENSNHTRFLAWDIDLFDADWNYIDDAEGHRIFGEWWKARDPRCRWGGDFSKPDGNHYSFEHDGVQ